jgi:transcriptional regulator with XRE-family HTH domain
MFFSSNIKYLRKRKKKTQDDMAFALNMKRSTLSGYENNVAEPGMQAIVALSDYFNVAVDTLIKIDLSTLSESQLFELEHGNDVYLKGSKLRVLTTTVNTNNEDNIELVPEKAKAGYSTGFSDPEYIKELPVFNLPFLSKEKKYRTFQISGDSMLPIPEGTWVTGEFVQDWSNIKDNEAYIILTYNEGIVFKIVENKLKSDRKFILHSLNPLYKPYEISPGEIREIWKFENYISSEIPEPKAPVDELFATINALKEDMEQLKSNIGSAKKSGK